MAGYIFGKGTPDTYESLQAKRATAARLAANAVGRAPQNVGEGLNALGEAFLYRRLNNQADKGMAEGLGRYNEKRGSLLGQLLGGMPTQAPNAAAGTPFAAPGGASAPPVTQGPIGGPASAVADDTMRALGKPAMPDAGGQFAAIEAQYGLPQGYLDRTAQIESGGNPNAQNPNSSAGGLFQFIDSTAKQYGLTNKFDPAAATDAAARLAADNKALLSRVLGREPTAGELYLAHQQGGGGAAKLLSNPNARAVDIVGADAVRLNGGDVNMTAGEFAGKWVNKFSGGAAPQPPQGNPMGAASIPALIELINDPFAPEGDRAMLGILLQRQLDAMQPQDPMEAIALEKAQLELAQMRNPQDKEAPETKSITLADGSQVLVQWNPQAKTWDPAPIPQGGTGGQGMGKQTEFQAKTRLFQTLQSETAPALSSLEAQWNPANLGDPAAAMVPIAGNYFTSPEYQIYKSAAAAWAEGALRISTGAAATEPEIQRVINTYFAQPGDTPATVAYKAQMRDMYSRATGVALGKPDTGSLPDPVEFLKTFNAPASPKAIKNDAEYDALPSGAEFIGPDGKMRRKP